MPADGLNRGAPEEGARAGVRAAADERPYPVERDGNEVLLLEGGDQFFPALERALAQARAQVFVETYIFHDDPAASRVAGAMCEAAVRGVRVHLVVDGYGTPRMPVGIERALRAAGVRVETFRPDRGRFALSRSRLRRLHRKIAVVDDAVAFVGGINFVDDRVDPRLGALDAPRFDFAVRVRGPLVADVLRAAQRLWTELSIRNRPLRALREAAQQWRLGPPAPPAPAGRLRAMLVLRDNVRFRRTIEREYLRAMLRARREITIASAYFFPGARFRRALVRAAARGVRVTLLLQGRVEYAIQHYASQALYDELLRAGVEIVEYRASFLHAKVAVIDDWATVGSSNIDPFSLLLAREANVVVRDVDFASALRARLADAIASAGKPVQLRRHARRPWPVRVLNVIGFTLLRLGVAITGVGGRY